MFRMLERIKRWRERRRPEYVGRMYKVVETRYAICLLNVPGNEQGWRGEWLEPRKGLRVDQVLEIRIGTSTCRYFNILFTHKQLRGMSLRNVQKYMEAESPFFAGGPAGAAAGRQCVGRIIAWFQERVRAEL